MIFGVENLAVDVIQVIYILANLYSIRLVICFPKGTLIFLDKN